MFRLSWLAAIVIAASFISTAPTAAAGEPAAKDCCPKPCVRYCYHGRNCCETVKKTLKVYNPCTCCCYEITVCLPKCCDDCPKVNSRRALFRRHIVNFSYCCGARVRVVIDRCGDMVVHVHS